MLSSNYVCVIEIFGNSNPGYRNIYYAFLSIKYKVYDESQNDLSDV